MMGQSAVVSGKGDPGGYSLKTYLVLSFVAMITMGCRGSIPMQPSEILPKPHISNLGYVIQAGAFSRLNNAVRLVEKLQTKGLDAYYFPHESGFFKVRFGNYTSRELAKVKAMELMAAGQITDYYIVDTDEYPGRRVFHIRKEDLRESIVRTADRFIGLPYRWGGTSLKEGFDCSGLVMATYRLNGLDLPRTSRQQWRKGIPIESGQLSKADLLFFSSSPDGKITHVGLYIGEGRFIHAPGRGKKIRTDHLSNSYFKKTYMGARTFL